MTQIDLVIQFSRVIIFVSLLSFQIYRHCKIFVNHTEIQFRLDVIKIIKFAQYGNKVKGIFEKNGFHLTKQLVGRMIKKEKPEKSTRRERERRELQRKYMGYHLYQHST